MPNKFYFDYASSSPLDKEVYQSYIELLGKSYANSESLYDDGVYINNLLNKARHSLATSFLVKPNEIIFTSGASEANNLAIKGTCFRQPNRRHIITSTIEHSSVLEVYRQLERVFDYHVTYVPVDSKGYYDLEYLKNSLSDDTLLVSLMWVNNETGRIQDINSIKKIVKAHPKTYLHIDGVQALGKLNIDLNDIDLISFSSHKIHGLKGSGILIKKNNIKLEPLIIAGQQEYGLRGGTTDALVHIMWAKTLRLALLNQEKYQSYLLEIKTYLYTMLNSIDGISFNSEYDNSTNIINISTPLKSEVMLNALNAKGIMVSALSTCHSSKETSHVLQAMGISDERIRTSMRISFSYSTTSGEIDELVKSIREVIELYGIS